MSIDSAGILNALSSHCGELGVFESITTHEPKSAPGKGGASVSLWISSYTPVQSSGLNSLSMRLEVMARIYTSMLQEPADEIDTTVLSACDALLTSIVGDFQLGGNVRMVDVFGSEGEGLRATLGYLTQDSKVFRVMDVFIPVIVNDVYTESP